MCSTTNTGLQLASDSNQSCGACAPGIATLDPTQFNATLAGFRYSQAQDCVSLDEHAHSWLCMLPRGFRIQRCPHLGRTWLPTLFGHRYQASKNTVKAWEEFIMACMSSRVDTSQVAFPFLVSHSQAASCQNGQQNLLQAQNCCKDLEQYLLLCSSNPCRQNFFESVLFVQDLRIGRAGEHGHPGVSGSGCPGRLSFYRSQPVLVCIAQQGG